MGCCCGLPAGLIRSRRPPNPRRDHPHPRRDAARQRHPVQPVLDPVTSGDYAHHAGHQPHRSTAHLHLPTTAGVPNGRPADGLTRGTLSDRPGSSATAPQNAGRNVISGRCGRSGRWCWWDIGRGSGRVVAHRAGRSAVYWPGTRPPGGGATGGRAGYRVGSSIRGTRAKCRRGSSTPVGARVRHPRSRPEPCPPRGQAHSSGRYNESATKRRRSR